MSSQAFKRLFATPSISALGRVDRRRLVRKCLTIEGLESRNLMAVYTVNVTTDDAPSSGGVGSGFIGDLRYALARAAANPGADTIEFSLPANSIIAPNLGPSSAFGLTAFQFSDQGGVTIDGTGSPGLTIDGQESWRLFVLHSSSGTASLKLKNLTIANGLARGGKGGDGFTGGGGGAGLGGAIFVSNTGSLNSEGVTFVNNIARGGDGGDSIDFFRNSGEVNLAAGGGGGGLAANGGNAIMPPASIRGGAGGGATGGGGGNTGIELTQGGAGNGGFGGGGGGGGVTARVNAAQGYVSYVARPGGDGGYGAGGGGGAYNALSFGSPSSGAAGGSAGFSAGRGGRATDNGQRDVLYGGEGGNALGGAIFSDGGRLTIVNSTFHNNSAIAGLGGLVVDQRAASGTGQGGAIAIRNGSLFTLFSTFSDNTAAQGGSSVFVTTDASNNGFVAGTGLANVTLLNNVIGQRSDKGTDFATATINGGFSPVMVSQANFVSRQSGLTVGVINASGADPKLDRLSWNGGATKTMAPRPGSPLLNAGTGVGPATFANTAIDQTGVARDSQPTIGAVEELAGEMNYVVTVNSDQLNLNGTVCDVNLGTGTSVCSPAITLRDVMQAIVTREPSGGAPAGRTVNKITFAPRLRNATIQLLPTLTTIPVDATNLYGTTAFVLASIGTVIIDGANAPGLVLSGGNATRLFEVQGDTDLTIRNLTIADGQNSGGNRVFIGAIETFAGGFRRLYSDAGLGGAIRVDGGNFTAENTLFSNNKAIGGRGGPDSVEGPGLGGVIFSSDGNVSLLNSTFVNNSATGSIYSILGLFNVLAQNGAGGAVFMRNGSLTAAFNTFTENRGSAGGNSIVAVSDVQSRAGYLPGVATVNVSNNIMGQAADQGAEFIARTAYGEFGSITPILTGSTGNVLRNNSTFEGLPPSAIRISGVDPQLGQLGNHGGPTKTIPVFPDSPAFLPAEFLQNVPATDQRGLPRPGTFASQLVFAGAYAPQASEFQTTLTVNNSNVTYGTSVTLTATALLAGQPIPGPDSDVKFFLGGNEIARIPLNSQGVATYTLTLPAGQHSFTAAYEAGIFQQTVVGMSSPTTVTVNKALPIVGFDPITKVGRAIGQAGENLTNGLTLRYSTNGGTTLMTTPPASGAYSVYYTFYGDANHQNVTTFTIAGKVAGISGESYEAYYNGSPFLGRVRAIGVAGEDLTSFVQVSYQRRSTDPNVSYLSSTNPPVDPGVYDVQYYRFNAPGYFPVFLPLFQLTHYNVGATVTVLSGAEDVNLQVSTLIDEDNGIYDPAFGTGMSLREAINFANLHPASNTITFAPGLSGTIKLGGTRLPNVEGDLTITGPGADLLTISGDRKSGIVWFSSGTQTLSGLSFTQGAGGPGGAMQTGSTLTIDRCTFFENVSLGGGGSIANFGNLTVTNSSFENNQANFGGAISNLLDSISQLNVRNSTFSGNSADYGGAIDNSGNALIVNSTIAFNRSDVGGGIQADKFSGPNSVTTLINTILGGNTNAAGTAANDFEALGAGGLDPNSHHNLIGPGGAGGLTNGTNSNIVAPSVMALGLNAIGNNGGATRTVSLKPLSPAINSGDNEAANGFSDDQRRSARIVGSTVDIGAFESPDFGPKSILLSYTPADVSLTLAVGGGQPISQGTFSLTEQLLIGNLSSQDAVQVTGTNDSDTFNLSESNLKVNTANVYFVGSAKLSLVGGSGDDIYQLDADASLGKVTLEETGSGLDTIDFSNTSLPVVLSLGLSTTQLVNANLSLTLSSTTGFERLMGGSGNDRLTGNTRPNVLIGNDGDDRLIGGVNGDTLIGGKGNDVISGNNGNDRIDGGAGNDSLMGGNGDDTYIFANATASEADSINELPGGGNDALDFSALTSTVNLNLSVSAFAQPVTQNRTLKLTSGAAIENASGGSSDDTLIGNSLANRLIGNAGNDRLRGEKGSDTLVGGQGNDTYLFEETTTTENDSIVEAANEGVDTVSFASLTIPVRLDLGSVAVQSVHSLRSLKLSSVVGVENAVGGSGDDHLSGNTLPNVLVGNAGNDRLLGNGGNDILIGGLGQDTLLGGAGDDLLIAGFTNYDSKFTNLIALMSAWNATGVSYQQRIANLRGGLTVSLIAGSTVRNDGSPRESLIGNDGKDWFFGAIDDLMPDLLAHEVLNRI